MSRDEEKKKDAQNEEEVTLEEPEIGEDEAPDVEEVDDDDAGNEEDVAEDGGEDEMLTTQDDLDRGKELKNPEPESKPEETPLDPVMMVGKDTPTIAGPSVVMINRAAIVYLAKHLMAPPDLEDFKIAFPSLF